MRKTSAPPAVYLYTLTLAAGAGAGAAYVTLRMAERRARHSGLDAESIAAAQRINHRLQHDAG